MKTTFIYILSCPLSDHVRYIGKSDNPQKRLLQHIRRCEKEISRKNSWLRGLKKKSLFPDLIIIDEVPTMEWEFWEQYYISLFKSWGFDLLNMTNGGDSPPINRWNAGKKMSQEYRDKCSKAQKGNKNGLGRKLSEESKQKMSDAHKGNQYSLGRVLSDETKRKIGDSKKGNKNMLGKCRSEETKKKISMGHKGKVISEETRAKMRKSKTGIVMSEETKEKIRQKAIARQRIEGRFV